MTALNPGLSGMTGAAPRSAICRVKGQIGAVPHGLYMVDFQPAACLPAIHAGPSVTFQDQVPQHLPALGRGYAFAVAMMFAVHSHAALALRLGAAFIR